MRHYELPPEEAKKLVSTEKARSWKFRMIYLGVSIAIFGSVIFGLAFLYQNPLNQAGFPYRQVQLAGILFVFVGWLVFRISCGSLGISTRNLSYSKLAAILKNQVEIPLDVWKTLRRQLAISLMSLKDDWALYPSLFADDPKKHIPAVLSGPGGIFAIQLVYQNPRKNDFMDPAPGLAAARADLEKLLKQPVTPVLAFMRSKKHYATNHEEIKLYTLPELLAYIESRQTTLDGAALQQIESEIQYLANLPRKAVEVSNSNGKVGLAAT